MNRTLLAFLAASAVLIGLTAVLFYPARSRPAVEENFLYMYCPECEREWRYNPEVFEKGCPRCEGDLTGSKESLKAGGQAPGRFTKLFLLIYAELLVVMAGVWYLTKRNADRPVAYRHMRCGRCEQKLRFRELQIGNPGACPRCKHRFTFADEELDEE